MPDVFISYSRRDLDFVKKLHAALVARGKDVWVDFEDIPLTAEWLDEVFEGIESSDNFLFLISPDSLESQVCAVELKHALDQRKRLVPGLLRAADGRPVPAALGARNWTFFTDAGKFDSSVVSLVEALDTDLEWVSAHTRLLGRALEWDREGRDGSYLLRGRDLQEAERWVASQTPERYPQLTPLQLEYTLAGRRAAARRQRRLVGAALVAVAVSLTLALLALYQRNEARREANIAKSRELAAEAEARLDTDPTESLRLAVDAATTRDTGEAADALRKALRSSLARGTVNAGTRVFDVDFSPGGTSLVAAGEDGTARVWSVEAPEALETVATLRANGPLSSARFGPGGDLLVTAGTGGAQLWRLAAGTGEPVASFDRDLYAAVLSPDERLLATAGDGGLVLWNARTRRRLRELVGGRSVAAAFGNNGARLVAATGSTATIWAVPSGRRVAVLDHGARVSDVAFMPNGRQVVTADDQGVARLWDAASGRAVATLLAQPGAMQSLAPSSDGRLLVTAADNGARVSNLGTRAVVTELVGHANQVLAVAIRTDDRLIATGGADKTVRLWGAPDEPLMRLEPRNQQRFRDIDFSPDGRLLVTGSEDTTARLWRAGGTLARVVASKSDWIESVTFSDDGKLVLTAGDDATAKIWRSGGGPALATLTAAEGQALYTADFSPDGELVTAAGEDGAVRLWRWRDRSAPRVLGEHEARVDAVASAPDGRSIASASWDGTVRLWATDGPGDPIATLDADGEQLTSVAFSPDGTLVAAGGLSRSVRLWDAETHRLVHRFVSRGAQTFGVAFSRDGRFLATADDDGAARVFAVEDRQLVARLPTTAQSLEAVAFSPVDLTIAVAGDEGLAAVLDCLECRPLEELLCLADERLSRSTEAGCSRRD